MEEHRPLAGDDPRWSNDEQSIANAPRGKDHDYCLITGPPGFRRRDPSGSPEQRCAGQSQSPISSFRPAANRVKNDSNPAVTHFRKEGVMWLVDNASLLVSVLQVALAIAELVIAIKSLNDRK